jgi:MFS family permease
VGGLGAGLVFLPSAAVLSHWFRKKRALSYGIIATGSSMGGVLFPIMLNRLFAQVGFKWAVRIAAFVMLACLITANILIRPRLPPRQRGSFIELHHFKDPAFSLLVAAAFFIILGGRIADRSTVPKADTTLILTGIYTPIFYISTYAESRGVETTLAFYILAILNACSILGRLIPNIFADKIGPQK